MDMLYFAGAVFTYFLYCIAIEKMVRYLDSEDAYFEPVAFRVWAYLFCAVVAGLWYVSLPFIVCAGTASWIANKGDKK